MLYKLNSLKKDTYQRVKRVSLADIGWKEKDLERLIANNIEDFIHSNELMTIFTERSLQEEPDILALDDKGDLYIFELKRWGAKQENLLQVLRYGQLFGASNYDDLNELYRKYAKNPRVQLLTDFNSYFGKNLTETDINQNQYFLVVTNGLDQATVESIIYWKKCGLNIDAVVYWVFEIGGEYYIEFNMYSKTEDFLEYETNCYVLNTNMSSDPKYTEEMLRDRKAAAYYPGWREKIHRLQKGDTVFLYKNGVGIIAYGIANGELHKAPCDGYDDYEYYMYLDKFVILKKPITASKMKEIANCGFQFRQTMFSISEDIAKKLKEYSA